MTQYSAEQYRRQAQEFSNYLRKWFDSLGVRHAHLTDAQLREVVYRAVVDLLEAGTEITVASLLDRLGVSVLAGVSA